MMCIVTDQGSRENSCGARIRQELFSFAWTFFSCVNAISSPGVKPSHKSCVTNTALVSNKTILFFLQKLPGLETNFKVRDQDGSRQL